MTYKVHCEKKEACYVEQASLVENQIYLNKTE